MAEPNGEQSLMHMLQAFLVDTINHVAAQLPDEADIVTKGRTLLRGHHDGRDFGVRVQMGMHEGDLWPHIAVTIEHDGDETSFDVHPDTTPKEHAEQIVERLV